MRTALQQFVLWPPDNNQAIGWKLNRRAFNHIWKTTPCSYLNPKATWMVTQGDDNKRVRLISAAPEHLVTQLSTNTPFVILTRDGREQTWRDVCPPRQTPAQAAKQRERLSKPNAQTVCVLPRRLRAVCKQPSDSVERRAWMWWRSGAGRTKTTEAF